MLLIHAIRHALNPINDHTESSCEQKISFVASFKWMYTPRKRIPTTVFSESKCYPSLYKSGHRNVLWVITGLLNILEAHFYSAFSLSSSGHHLYWRVIHWQWWVSALMGGLGLAGTSYHPGPAHNVSGVVKSSASPVCVVSNLSFLIHSLPTSPTLSLSLSETLLYSKIIIVWGNITLRFWWRINSNYMQPDGY